MFWLSRGVNLYPTTKGGKLAIKKKKQKTPDD